MFEPSKRSKKVQYAIRDIVVEAKKLEKQGKKVLYLNIGDPLKYDFKTPEHILEAAREGIKRGMSYAPSEGIEEARIAIAKDYGKKGLKVDEEDIIMGNGCSELIMMVLGAALNPNDELLLPRPCYPLYIGASSFFQLKTRFYTLDEELEWQIDTNKLSEMITKKTKAIVIINPNNPTGSVLKKKIAKEILKIARENEILVIADEIYDRLVLDSDKEPKTIASLDKDAYVISLNGLSKNFLATGFRVGWLAPSKALQDSELVEAIKKLARIRVCSVHPMQYAVKAALEGPMGFLKEVKEKLKKRRELLKEKIETEASNKLSFVEPKAAFYAYIKARWKKRNDKEFVLRLLKEKQVCVVHGSGFGSKPAELYFRLVYLPQEKILNEALNRIIEFLR